jgi:hypothetical protein
VKGKVDVSEPSTYGNSSLATKENLAFQETIDCHGCREEHEEPVPEWIKCDKCSKW